MDTYGFELACGLRGAGTSHRTKGPNLEFLDTKISVKTRRVMS